MGKSTRSFSNRFMLLVHLFKSLEHIRVATHIPSNCSVSPGLPHDVLIDEGGHSQHLIDS